MGGKMDAAYWREYRKRKAETLRAYERERRKKPTVRAQRYASEARRRAHIRLLASQQPMAATPHGHALYEAARRIVGEWNGMRGQVLAFSRELDHEDELGEAVLALIEGSDPVAAVKAVRTQQRQWEYHTVEDTRRDAA